MRDAAVDRVGLLVEGVQRQVRELREVADALRPEVRLDEAAGRRGHAVERAPSPGRRSPLVDVRISRTPRPCVKILSKNRYELSSYSAFSASLVARDVELADLRVAIEVQSSRWNSRITAVAVGSPSIVVASAAAPSARVELAGAAPQSRAARRSGVVPRSQSDSLAATS